MGRHLSRMRAESMKKPDEALVSERKVLITYLLTKALAEDWHAVADAAMDLREIDARLSVLGRPV